MSAKLQPKYQLCNAHDTTSHYLASKHQKAKVKELSYQRHLAWSKVRDVADRIVTCTQHLQLSNIRQVIIKYMKSDGRVVLPSQADGNDD